MADDPVDPSLQACTALPPSCVSAYRGMPGFKRKDAIDRPIASAGVRIRVERARRDRATDNADSSRCARHRHRTARKWSGSDRVYRTRFRRQRADHRLHRYVRARCSQRYRARLANHRQGAAQRRKRRLFRDSGQSGWQQRGLGKCGRYAFGINPVCTCCSAIAKDSRQRGDV